MRAGSKRDSRRCYLRRARPWALVWELAASGPTASGLLAGSLLASGLVGCAPDADVHTISLRLSQVQSCAVGSVQRVSVVALGDFDSPREERDSQRAASTLSLADFPVDTRELTFEVHGRSATGHGVLSLEHASVSGEQTTRILPLSRSCPLGDPLAGAGVGAQVAALADGSLLVAGGQDLQDDVLSSALLLPSGGELLQQVPEGMLLRRAFGTATAVAHWVVVAGGSADPRADAHETYEVFDARSGRFDRERSQKLLTGPRMQHGALALPDGRVLLVGGRSAPPSGSIAPLLASAELIDPDSSARVALIDERAPLLARTTPTVLLLDTQQVLVVGGFAGDGQPVTQVELFDLDTQRFVLARDDAGAPVRVSLRARHHAVALPGGRVAVLACDADDVDDADDAGETGDGSCELSLLLPGPQPHVFSVQPLALDFAQVLPNGLRDLQLIALADGRLLFTGADPRAPVARRAFVVDVNTASLSTREASRVPSVLLPLADGSIAELDAFGASLRRESLTRAYAAPQGNLIAQEGPVLALDAPTHFSRETSTLRALQAGARVTVAALRFHGARITAAGNGGMTLSLHFDDGEPLDVRRDGTRVRSGPCTLELAQDQALVVVREGASLRIGGESGDAASCTRSTPAGAFGISLALDLNSVLSLLRAQRL